MEKLRNSMKKSKTKKLRRIWLFSSYLLFFFFTCIMSQLFRYYRELKYHDLFGNETKKIKSTTQPDIQVIRELP